MKIELMQKSRKRANILIVVINVVFLVAFIITHRMEKWNYLKWIFLTAFLILATVYFVYVICILEPAVKRILYLAEQRKDLLRQFWVFLIAFLVKGVLSIVWIVQKMNGELLNLTEMWALSLYFL